MKINKFAVILILASACFSSSYGAVKEKNVIKFGRDVHIGDTRTVRAVASVIGNSYIFGTAEDDVIAIGGSVVVGRKGYIGGNVVAVGGVIDKKDGGVIRGNVVEINIPGLADTSGSGLQSKIRNVFQGLKIASFIGFLLLAVLLVAIVPKPIEIISLHVRKNTISVLQWSLKGLLFIVPLAVVLTMSVAGIFMIPVEVILVVSASLFGFFAVARTIGQILCELVNRPGRTMYFETVIGVLVISIVGMIPVIGWVIKAILGLMGLGGVLAAIFDRKKAKALGIGEFSVTE